ncbi:hypothetical protein RclHR1_06390009 [Rhizophagus clarus]|nr:hypothetical protein RclHR1_06390009 [Rhizophagus clarus]
MESKLEKQIEQMKELTNQNVELKRQMDHIIKYIRIEQDNREEKNNEKVKGSEDVQDNEEGQDIKLEKQIKQTKEELLKQNIRLKQ